jgi:hypothetical protein
MNTSGSNRISPEDLQLYFDGELTGAEAQELSAQIDAEPALRSQLEEMGVVRDLVSAGLERRAQEVPQARFEQIWGEIDRAIDADVRAHEAAVGSVWSRLSAALRSVRLPVLAAAGAAALAVVVLRSFDGSSDANKADEVASVEQPDAAGTPRHSSPPEPMSPHDAIASAPPSGEPEVRFSEPRAAEADIHSIEFGGRNGRIGQTGTVTVLYVEEEPEDDNDSERSL